MNNCIELFRVLVGSVSQARDYLNETNRIQKMIQEITKVLAPLDLSKRLQFEIIFDRDTNTQWLITLAKQSLERLLFEEVEAEKTQSTLERDSLSVKAMKRALENFQILCQQTQWNPAELYQWISEGAQDRQQLRWPVTEDGTAVTPPNGDAQEFKFGTGPKRVTLNDVFDVIFSVEMMGKDRASVVLPKDTRKNLKISSRCVDLHWWQDPNKMVFRTLGRAWYRGIKVSGKVQITINKSQDCVALQLITLSAVT